MISNKEKSRGSRITTYTLFTRLEQSFKLKIGQIRTTEIKLRIWNEVATLIMFAIIFMAVLKDSISWIYDTFSLVGLAVLLMISIKLYKKNKTK